MKRSLTNYPRLLALDPTSTGFGFIVLEGDELIDWGVNGVKGDRNKESLRKIGRLIDRYQPDVLVMEHYDRKSRRRTMRTKELIEELKRLAQRRGSQPGTISQSQIQVAFEQCGAITKHQIAVEIAKRFPELLPSLPPLRKPWKSEDKRMSIFDAAALAVTFFSFEQKRRRSPWKRVESVP
jgi:RNase H-fold protein (predicted Holliday junction resolvase)